MVVSVVTQDCSLLNDIDLEHMAVLSSASSDWGVGLISKEKDNWVLCTRAEEDGVLSGFMFTSLERIGGTPALLVGVACVKPGDLNTFSAMVDEQFRKAYMAFPDEDVVVAIKTDSPDPLLMFKGLSELQPTIGQKPNGEQRAWGRRLAKRFGIDNFDDHTMVAKATSADEFLFDYQGDLDSYTEDFLIPDEVGSFVIAWGWAMVEFLEKANQQPLSSVSASG